MNRNHGIVIAVASLLSGLGACEWEQHLCASASEVSGQVVLDLAKGQNCQLPVNLWRWKQVRLIDAGGQIVWSFQATTDVEISRLVLGASPAGTNHVVPLASVEGLRGSTLRIVVDPTDATAVVRIPRNHDHSN